VNLPEGLIFPPGVPYPRLGGHDQVRAILSIAADKIHGMG
jgi:hypothetical protein